VENFGLNSDEEIIMKPCLSICFCLFILLLSCSKKTEESQRAIIDDQPQILEKQETAAVNNPDDMLKFSEDSKGAEVCDTTGLILGVLEIDTTGKIILPQSGSCRGLFSGGLLKVRIEEKWGYIDTTGKIVITPQYLGAGDFSEEGRAPVMMAWDDTIRYIDKTGKTVSTWPLSAAAVENQDESEALHHTAGKKLNVLSRAGLELKEASDPHAKTLGVVPYGEQVSVLEDSAEKIKFKMDGISGYWILAKYGDITGYIFDGCLSRLPAPAEDCHSLEQYVDEKLAGSDKREKLVIDPWDSGTHSELEIQKCRYEAILEMFQGWESRSETLRIPQIRLEEGFLIAKLFADKSFENAIFPENPGQIQMSRGDANINIQKNKMNQVEISFEYCCD
jgi:hypothetical protein